MKPDMPAALAAVQNAIAHARAKHGDRTIDHLELHYRVSVLVEEVGEVARACQADLEYDMRYRESLRAELAQVAACALMWLAAEYGEEADRG